MRIASIAMKMAPSWQQLPMKSTVRGDLTFRSTATSAWNSAPARRPELSAAAGSQAEEPAGRGGEEEAEGGATAHGRLVE